MELRDQQEWPDNATHLVPSHSPTSQPASSDRPVKALRDVSINNLIRASFIAALCEDEEDTTSAMGTVARRPKWGPRGTIWLIDCM